MTVWCRQTDSLTGDNEYEIVRHHPEQTDEELLGIKERSAREKGWTVKRIGPTAFTATKKRWGGVTCVRRFEIR